MIVQWFYWFLVRNSEDEFHLQVWYFAGNNGLQFNQQFWWWDILIPDITHLWITDGLRSYWMTVLSKEEKMLSYQSMIVCVHVCMHVYTHAHSSWPTRTFSSASFSLSLWLHSIGFTIFQWHSASESVVTTVWGSNVLGAPLSQTPGNRYRLYACVTGIYYTWLPLE